MEKKSALLLVVSAPSGAGKSTLCNRLIGTSPNMVYSISCTTRAPRGAEVNHEHYHFLSHEEFSERVKRGEFIEYAEVHGNFYGTLKSTVQESLERGIDLIMDIDVQGAGQIRSACAALPEEDLVRRGFVDLFVAPPSMEELHRRLRGRATDEAEVIAQRMKNAEAEMSAQGEYRHLIVNDNLDVALQTMERIVSEEHQKRA